MYWICNTRSIQKYYNCYKNIEMNQGKWVQDVILQRPDYLFNEKQKKRINLDKPSNK